jgi:hypothetical protein
MRQNILHGDSVRHFTKFFINLHWVVSQYASYCRIVFGNMPKVECGEFGRLCKVVED